MSPTALSDLGGPELLLLPAMLVFYVAIPLALIYLILRNDEEEEDRSQ